MAGSTTNISIRMDSDLKAQADSARIILNPWAETAACMSA